MKILFQGDSITDAGRNREDFWDIGPGYPFFQNHISKNLKTAIISEYFSDISGYLEEISYTLLYSLVIPTINLQIF